MKTKRSYTVVSHTFPGEQGTERAAASIYADGKPLQRFSGKTAHQEAQRVKALLETPATANR